MMKEAKEIYENLLTCTSGMAEEIFLNFRLWLTLHEGYSHYKFCAIRIRHHRAIRICVKSATLFLLLIYLLRLHTPCFLKLHDILQFVLIIIVQHCLVLSVIHISPSTVHITQMQCCDLIS